MKDLFLSPSRQNLNIYYDGSGSEKYYMDLIADAMEPYLIASGISFTRAGDDMTLAQVVNASNAEDYRYHLAIHSNAAGPETMGKAQGTDVYYYDGSEKGEEFADVIVANYKDIYPDPEKVRTLPNTTFAELRKVRAPSVLIETAFHDNPADAEWIKANIKQIGGNLAFSVAEVLGVPFIEPGELTEGIVTTAGSNLNIRVAPSTDSEIIGSLKNGARVTLTGYADGWYSVSTDNLNGYVFGKYIRRAD